MELFQIKDTVCSSRYLFFPPDRFVQFLVLIPMLILLLYLLVSIDLVKTGICEIRYQELFWRRTTVC